MGGGKIIKKCTILQNGFKSKPNTDIQFLLLLSDVKRLHKENWKISYSQKNLEEVLGAIKNDRKQVKNIGKCFNILESTLREKFLETLLHFTSLKSFPTARIVTLLMDTITSQVRKLCASICLHLKLHYFTVQFSFENL